MNKSYIKYFVILIALLVLYTVFEVTKPQPINWSETYAHKDKIPYGTYIAHKLMDDVFPNQEVNIIREPAYNHLDGWLLVKDIIDSTIIRNYVFISRSTSFDTLDISKLLDFAENGNNVFIAAESYSYTLRDTFKLETDYKFIPNRINDLKDVLDTITFTNQSLAGNKIFYPPRNLSSRYFSSFDTANASIIATNVYNNPIMLRYPIGKAGGNFFFCSTPKLFTNYNLVDSTNYEFASIAFSHLPVAGIFWDEYTNLGREGGNSPLRFIFANKGLKWAYFIALFTSIFFIIFDGKRKQRIIPVLKPLANTTVEFVETIGRLYFNYGDHSNLARKKVQFLLEYVRKTLFVDTHTLDDDFFKKLSNKARLSYDEVKLLFTYASNIQKGMITDKLTLIRLNELIDNFYEKTR